MAKKPTKSQASKAAKILSSSRAGTKAKSKAGKVLAAKRTVKTPKKTGRITRVKARKAVKAASHKRK